MEIIQVVAAAIVFASGIPVVLIGFARAKRLGAAAFKGVGLNPVPLREPLLVGARCALAVIAGFTLQTVPWVALLAIPVWALIAMRLRDHWLDPTPDIPDPRHEITSAEPNTHVRVVR